MSGVETLFDRLSESQKVKLEIHREAFIRLAKKENVDLLKPENAIDFGLMIVAGAHDNADSLRLKLKILIWSIVVIATAVLLSPVDVMVGDVCLSCWGK